MLIVISDTGFKKEEAVVINALFDEGLQLFHLRKSYDSASEIEKLLVQIHPVHLSKITLHQQHILAEKFGMKRLHFSEATRKKAPAKEWMQLKEKGFHLSTSVHNTNEVVPDEFESVFFGPVFDSISKEGYTSIITEHRKFKIQNSKWIALGGIDENNCIKAFAMGFESVAVLGAVWKSADPLKKFKKIQKECSCIAQ